jgi:hypothetical protein
MAMQNLNALHQIGILVGRALACLVLILLIKKRDNLKPMLLNGGGV